MESATRQDCTKAVIKFAGFLNKFCGLSQKLLMVGLAGDKNPKGDYSYLFSKFNITTLDINSKWKPDIIAPITDENLKSDNWDIIVMTQVLEHCENPFEVSQNLYRILKNNGYLVIDSPWNYPWHPEPECKDFYRFSSDGMKFVFNQFKDIDNYCTQSNNSFLFQKT